MAFLSLLVLTLILTYIFRLDRVFSEGILFSCNGEEVIEHIESFLLSEAAGSGLGEVIEELEWISAVLDAMVDISDLIESEVSSID